MSKTKGKTREEIINNLAERIDQFEKYSTPHSQAMAEMATHLARRMGLSQADTQAIAEAARLHDIGLYAMSPAYHGVRSAPRFEERLDLWRHSIIGEQEMAKREASRYAQLLVRWHHEWWNGSGYPDMLAFEDIPIGARILRAVELYNALTSDRPYRSAYFKQEALEVLQASAGIECDPYVVHALLALLAEMQVEEEPQATVIPDEAITTSTLEEIQAEDAITTARLNRQTLTVDSSLIDQQKTEVQEDAASIQQTTNPVSPANPEAQSSINQQPESKPAEDSASSSVWANPPSVWSMPQEPPPSSTTTTQPFTQPTAHPANVQPDAPSAVSGEALAPRANEDAILQSPNPLDALDDSPSEDAPTSVNASPHTAPPMQSEVATHAPSTASSSRFSDDDETPGQVAAPPADLMQTQPLTDTPSFLAPSPTAQTPAGSPAPVDAPATAKASVKHSPSRPLLSRLDPPAVDIDDAPNYRAWKESGYNKKSLLAFEASVLRQIQFSTVAIPFSGEAKLDWYLKAWGKRILANDPRAWAATAARALVESTEPLSEETITQLLTDIYVPGTRLVNSRLRRWFSETDAWWMDNLRRNIETLEDDKLRAQACLLGMQTGDYALSFNDETVDLRRPLTTVFWRLAGRFTIGARPQTQNRSYNFQAPDFIKNVRADLLFLNLPSSHHEIEGSHSRYEWRECWVKGLAADADDFAPTIPAPQSRRAYLLYVDKLLSAAAHLKKWAIACQENGLVAAREINELVKEHRLVRATYSKDVSEVAGGLRSYIIVAERE